MSINFLQVNSRSRHNELLQLQAQGMTVEKFAQITMFGYCSTGLFPQVTHSRPTAECNPGQVVYTHVPLSPSSIICFQPMGSDARQLGRQLQAWRKVMAACRRVMAWVTCGLTAEDQDQLWNPTLISSMGPLPYLTPGSRLQQLFQR